jgi:hypothetical protein
MHIHYAATDEPLTGNVVNRKPVHLHLSLIGQISCLRVRSLMKSDSLERDAHQSTAIYGITLASIRTFGRTSSPKYQPLSLKHGSDPAPNAHGTQIEQGEAASWKCTSIPLTCYRTRRLMASNCADVYPDQLRNLRESVRIREDAVGIHLHVLVLLVDLYKSSFSPPCLVFKLKS